MGTVSSEPVSVTWTSSSAKRTGNPCRRAVTGHGPEDDSRRQFRARPDELVRRRCSRYPRKGKRRSESALAILDDGHAAGASRRTIATGQSCRGVRSRLNIDTRCRKVVKTPSSCIGSCSRMCRIFVSGIYNACVLCQDLAGSGTAFPFVPLAQTVHSVLARFAPASIDSDDSSAKYQRISSLGTHRNLFVLIDRPSGPSSPMLGRRSRR